MRSAAIWIHAIRPKTLIASVSPVFIGTALALKDGAFDLVLFALTLLTGLGIQISTNLADDYFDFLKVKHTEERKGPLHATQSGLVSLTMMKIAVGISCFLTVLSGGLLVFEGGWLI